MNIQQRLHQLESRTDSKQQHGTPIKPLCWTDNEYTAIITGLGIRNRPFSILGINIHFIEKYREPINQILADLKNGKQPKTLLLQAEPLTYQETTDSQWVKYFKD
jgi:hypothetical protein